MNFIRVFLLTPLLSAALMLVSPLVLAQEVPPHDWHDKVEKFLDRGSPPAETFVWSKKLAARDVDASMRGGGVKWAANIFLCHSDSDDQYGACATSAGSGRSSRIKLRFTELRSGVSHSLELEAARNPYSSTNVNARALNDAGFANDSPNNLLHVYIPSSEMSQLPGGGIWKGHLKLRQMHKQAQVAVNEAEIVLHVTDTKNVQIYLPGHNTTAPTVDLGLSQPNGRDSRTTGSRSIDMCLYDGFGSNSSWFEVTVKDDLSGLRRKPGSFSVVRQGTSGGFYDRIDYGVSYLHEGRQKTLNNGETVRLIGGNGTGLRSVHLPNIPVPVMCQPMPLTLETPEFNAKDKHAGSYSGKLRIIFSPSAQSL